MIITPEIEAKFWSNVNKDGPVPAHMPHLGRCWVWMGCKHRQGYGLFSVCGEHDMAHRFAYRIAFKQKPQLCVLHHCDNTSCVNPNHLWLGTQLQNIKDRDAKGRQVALKGDDHYARVHPEKLARGERTGMAKLTNAKIVTIRQRASAGDCRYHLAKEFHVSWHTIERVVNRSTWNHVA